jgi:flagellar basal-body rod protein FlgF
MDNTSYIALSRQVALERQMAIVAGNIANMNTHGYKAEQVTFEVVFERAGTPGDVAFVRDSGLMRDQAPGALEITGNPLDLAINGDGYFAVLTDAGPRYTRYGHFEVDGNGQLATSAGYPLLDAGGATIQLPPSSVRISIARDGAISTDEGVVGQIALVRFANEADLIREGDSLFGTPQTPQPVDAPDIVQGQLERSNVQPILEMTKMMETVRAFQNTQRLLDTHHDMVRRVIEQASS